MDESDELKSIQESVKKYDGDEPVVLVAPDDDGMTVAHQNLSQQDMNSVIHALLQSQSKGAAIVCLKNVLESEFVEIDREDIRETVEWLTDEIGQRLSTLSLRRFLSPNN